MAVVEVIREILKSKKQKLYEKYIFDNEGKLKVYNPIVQSLLFEILEKAGLEDAVKEYDEEKKKEAKENCK